MRRFSLKKIFAISLGCLMLAGSALTVSVSAASLRLKDISHIKGIRNNQLIGYGLVVGLPKTGDKSRSTQDASWNLISNFGQRIQNQTDVRTTNTAAVIVTAIVPPFAKPGDPLDIMVSSLADASSLEGGVLATTQLMGPNGEVIALAQGPISTGGTSVSENGSSKRTAITTSGRIPGGAIIEREISTPIGDDSSLDIVLDRTDYDLSARVATMISDKVAPARALDGATVRVIIPDDFQDNRVALLAKIQGLEVNQTGESAKVVINERTGTIVIGNKVRLLPAAVAHGGITVSVSTTNSVSQPGAFAPQGTQSVGVSNSQISIEKGGGNLVQLGSNATLQDLVSALNSIGVKPSDLISILQALKAAGSLEATLEIM